MAETPHEDFIAHPQFRWQGQALKTLLPELRESAKQTGGNAKAVLPGGAWVGIRLADGINPTTVGIWRHDPFRTDDGESKWAAEVMTFMRVLGLLGWTKETYTLPNGGPIVVLRETTRAVDLFEG